MNVTPDPREEEKRAVARIGTTPDGELLCRLLYRELQSVTHDTADSGALYLDLGRRRFAQELIRELESEYARSRTGNDTRPGLGPRREPIRLSRARGARRPVIVSDDEAGGAA
jgi:hypothetical protein